MNIPLRLLTQASLVDTGRTLPSRGSLSWIVSHERGPAILRRLDPHLFPPASSAAADSVAWLHGFLVRLAATGFPAPRPMALFDGISWTLADDAIWELMSYLPGQAIGWDTEPPMPEVGAFMARFHNAVAQLPPLAQRDGAYPLDTLPARPVDEDLRPALDALEADLAAIDHPTAPRQVIHGDFTAQNVLACGRPPAVCGVIDFALSYVEVVWADIGFGLWRSGRPHQDAIHLDLDRVQDLISGYCRVRALPPQAVRAIAVYATARGLQQAVKGYGHGRRPPPMLMDRVQWLATHYNQLEDRIGRATTHE